MSTSPPKRSPAELEAALALAERRIAELEAALEAPTRQWSRVDHWQLHQVFQELHNDPRTAELPLPRALAAIDLRGWWTETRALPTPTEAARRWHWQGDAGRMRAARLQHRVTFWAEPRFAPHVQDYLRTFERPRMGLEEPR